MKRAIVTMTLFWTLVILLVSSSRAAEPMVPGDVKVEWTPGFPKKDGADFVMEGKVTFANGWKSVDGKIYITMAPKDGGVSKIPFIKIDEKTGTWKGSIPVNQFPAPAKEWIFVPTVQAQKDKEVEVYPVTAKVETKMLP
ncbi:MAG: hypothetical protein L0241_11500 [Planctomycetia bacterium]|nr:hypothetical protein [Planctomycetia bacterium]